MDLLVASSATWVAFHLFKTNILEVHPLFRVLGLVRVRDTHRRGMHVEAAVFLDEPPAVGVRQLEVPQQSGGAVAKRRHGTGARLKEASKGKGSPNLPLWTPLL